MKKLKLLFLFSFVSILVLGQATRPFIKSKSANIQIKPKKSSQISSHRTMSSDNFTRLKTTDSRPKKRNKLSLDRTQPNLSSQAQSAQKSTYNNYELLLGFEANWYDGVIPPSNSVAVNPNGDIVSVVNSSIDIYDKNGVFVDSKLLWEHYALDQLQGTYFFPSIYWDSMIDKFIMVSVHGFYADESNIIVSFSESEDPLGGWFHYIISGDLKNNGTWFDNPLVGMSDNDLFISGSLRFDDDTFDENVVIQIDKASAINTNNMNYSYWNSIPSDASSIFPVSHGVDGPYTPGILLVSTTKDGHYLYDITGDLDDFGAELKVIEFGDGFSPSFDAYQKGSDVTLDTGDGRVTGAFYLDGRIHMVHNASAENEYGEIHYLDLNVETLEYYEDIIAQDQVDLAYPNIIPIGDKITSPEVCIGYLSSSLNHYPSMELITFNGIDEWSSPVRLKDGVNPVIDAEDQDYSLWGKYVGLTRKNTNNTSPNIIYAGQYGTTRIYNGEDPYKCLETYIVEMQEKTEVSNSELSKQTALNIYPNPVKERCSIEFTSKVNQTLSLEIIGLDGQKVYTFSDSNVKSGSNIIDLDVSTISSGVYFLRSKDQQGETNKQKLIIL